ncbi:MAG: class I SAM-dependent methyltransferase [Armatimonadota bacterium]
MNNQVEFFDSYAERWDSMERDDICQLLARVVVEAGIKPGMNVLDVGTGTGVMIPCLLQPMNGEGSITAIDISPGMFRIAKSKGFSANVNLLLADIEDYDCGADYYDRVICNAVFPHFCDKPKALSRIFGMLKQGGMIVISHPTGREAVNKVHREAGPVVAEDQVPDAETMRAMLIQAGFCDIEVTDEPEFYLALGRKQNSTS